MILHLGVLDVAYPLEGGGKTTGEVAEILEDKYEVMGTFFDLEGQNIADAMASQMAGAIETLALSGREISFDSDVAGSKFGSPIEEMFRNFLDRNEMSRVLLKPVQAAQDGVNHRKLHPYTKDNKSRPAFIDTGLYQASFRAWITES